MTDETRYRCPGCDNEESGETVQAFKDLKLANPRHHWPCHQISAGCVVEMSDYKLIGEPGQVIFSGSLISRKRDNAADVASAEPEPEAEGAREWGCYWKDDWHRYPNGHGTSSACGKANIMTVDKSVTVLYAAPQGPACPACLPKPVEEEKPEGLVDGRFTSLKALSDAKSPPKDAEWVAPEWVAGGTIRTNMVRFAAALTAHVNAMLLPPGSSQAGIDLVNWAKGDIAIHKEPTAEVWGASPERCDMLAGHDVTPDDWTRVEDGLPEDEEPVQVLAMSRWYYGAHWGGFTPKSITHWRPKPEDD